MAFFTGQSGSMSVSVSGTQTQIARVKSWSLNPSVNVADITALGEFAQSNTPTLKSAQGSADIAYYTLEQGESGTTASTLITKVLKTGAVGSSDRVILRLNIDATRFITVNAWITSVSLGSSTGEVARASINFTVDGDYVAVSSI